MVFEIVCVILLVAILVATTLVLTILVRNLIRDFKKEVLAKVEEGMIPVLKKIDELEHQGSDQILKKLDELQHQGSDQILERLDDVIHHGLLPLGDRLNDLSYEIRSILIDPVGHGSSYMTGAYMSTEPGHSIHVFRNGAWELQENFSKAGYEANQPAMEGNYEGQVVKTISTPSPEDHS